MKVYIIYSVYFDPQEYKYREPPSVYIESVFSDELIAYKYICMKQIQEYIEHEFDIDDLPEFPDVDASLNEYKTFFYAITNEEYQEKENQYGMNYYSIEEKEVDKIDIDID
jgi:hypothetical protein